MWQLFLTLVEQRVVRETNHRRVGRLAAEARAEKQPEVTARIAGMHAFLDKMRGWYQQMIELPPATLRRLMNLGAGVTKWLPSQRKAKGRNDYWRRLCSRRGRRSTNRSYPSFGPNRLGAVLQRGWSGLRGVEPEFNMHFGYYRAGANPLRRESMLEQMNVEVLAGCAWPATRN